MALAPIPNPSVAPLIRRLAPQFKIDPRAAIAVALGEGGLQNRAKDIGDLSGGGSYGPFQLYTKGALPAQYRGRPQAADQWAWSPEGIKYALGRMAASGAAGLQGSAAVEAIIRKFERPLHPDRSVSNALARLSSIGGGSAIPGSSLPAALAGPSKPLTPSITHSTPSSGIRNILLQGLASGQEVYDLLPQLIAARGQSPIHAPQPLKTAPVASQAPSRPHSHAAETTTTPVKGFTPSFAQKLKALVDASGGRLTISSGFRDNAHQKRLYAAALKKYGSEREARKWVAKPGFSKHEHGIAADLKGDLKWAHQNAEKFGLWFPLSNENWHIEEQGSR